MPDEETTAPVVIDLDAMRAARASEEGVAPTLIFGGVTYELEARPPIIVLESIGGLLRGSFGALRTVLGAILKPVYEPAAEEGGEPVAVDLVGRIMADLNLDDAQDLVPAIAAAYGIKLGN